MDRRPTRSLGVLPGRVASAKRAQAPMLVDAGAPATRFRREVLIDAPFHAAGERLMSWQVQRSAFRVRSSVPRVTPGAIVEMSPGVLPLRFYCRVTEVIDEPNRIGFVYAALPGHPERGEERFVVERRAGGEVAFVIEAISRPSTRAWASLGVLLRAGQEVITRVCYLRALG